MADTIFYSIRKANDCDCYILNEEQVGNCINASACQCFISDYDISVFQPTAPTYFQPDGETVVGTLYDDGNILITLTTTGDFYQEEYDSTCYLPTGNDGYYTVSGDNILNIYRVPLNVEFGDTANYITVPTSNVTITYYGAGITEISLGGVVAEFIDDYSAGIKYVIEIKGINQNCTYRFYINEPYLYEINLNYDSPEWSATHFCCYGTDVTGDYLYTRLELLNSSGLDELSVTPFSNAMLIPSGFTFTIWVKSEMTTLLADFDLWVTYYGITTTLTLTGNVIINSTLEDQPYGGAFGTYDGWDITLTTDWDQEFTDLDITLFKYNFGAPDCSVFNALVADDELVILQFPNTVDNNLRQVVLPADCAP